MSYTPKECAEKLSILLRGRKNRTLDFSPFRVKDEFFHVATGDVVDRVSKAWFGCHDSQPSCFLSTEDLDLPACDPTERKTLHPFL